VLVPAIRCTPNKGLLATFETKSNPSISPAFYAKTDVAGLETDLSNHPASNGIGDREARGPKIMLGTSQAFLLKKGP